MMRKMMRMREVGRERDRERERERELRIVFGCVEGR